MENVSIWWRHHEFRPQLYKWIKYVQFQDVWPCLNKIFWLPDSAWNSPDSKVHGDNMGPIWGRQDPDGPHVDPMNFVFWSVKKSCISLCLESQITNIILSRSSALIYMYIYMYIPYTSSVIGRIYNGSVIQYRRSCTSSRSIGECAVPGLNAILCFPWFTNCVLLFDKSLILGCLWHLVFV